MFKFFKKIMRSIKDFFLNRNHEAPQIEGQNENQEERPSVQHIIHLLNTEEGAVEQEGAIDTSVEETFTEVEDRPVKCANEGAVDTNIKEITPTDITENPRIEGEQRNYYVSIPSAPPHPNPVAQPASDEGINSTPSP